MSNPEERACRRPDGPDCQWFSSKYFRCINWKCSRERGTNIPGGPDCSYYKPMGQTHEEILEELQGGFWSGAIFGVLIGGSIVLAIFIFIMVIS